MEAGRSVKKSVDSNTGSHRPPGCEIDHTMKKITIWYFGQTILRAFIMVKAYGVMQLSI